MRGVNGVLKRIGVSVTVLVVIASALLVMPAVKVAAFVTPYYAERPQLTGAVSGSPLVIGTSMAQQLVKMGNVFYYSDTGTGTIYRVENFHMTPIVGLNNPNGTRYPFVEGMNAIDSEILGAGIEVGPDGTLYIADPYRHRVVRLGTDGNLYTVAGNGTEGVMEADAAALQTPFNKPNYVKFGPDGLLYVSDDNVVRRINADGSVTRVAGQAGTYAPGSVTEGGPALEQTLPNATLSGKINPTIIEFDSAGRMYIGTSLGIYRVETDGTLTTIVASDYPTNDPVVREEQQLFGMNFPSHFIGFDLASDDSIWLGMATSNGVTSQDNNGTLFHIHDGTVTPIAGGGSSPVPNYGNLINVKYFPQPLVTPDGIYMANFLRFWNKNPNHVNDQFGPQQVNHYFSADPTATTLPTDLHAEFIDPFEGEQSSGVVAAEYYIDGVGVPDPGYGNGIPMTLIGNEYVATIPAGLPAGQASITFRAVDAAGNWSTNVNTALQVYRPPSFTSPDSLTTNVREPINFEVAASGGMPEFATIEFVDGMLPAGVTFVDEGNGQVFLRGQADFGTAGVYPLTFKSDNGSGAPATQEFTLTITENNAAPTILSDSLSIQSFGIPFSFTVNTTGSPVPVITRNGGLPNGVTFVDNHDGTATIAGTVTNIGALGDHPMNIKAKNAFGQQVQAFTLRIVQAPVFKTKAERKGGRVGETFSFTVRTTGYETPTLNASGMPNSISFVDNGDGTGTFSGTPEVSEAGSYQVEITAQNQYGFIAKTIAFNIKGAPTEFTSGDTINLGPGNPFNFQLQANGFPLPKFSQSGDLPEGVSFDRTTGTFSGTPTSNSIGTYMVTVTAKNRFGSVSQTITITVTPGGGDN